MAGTVNEYFTTLREEIAAAKSAEDAQKLAEKFPRGGALGILDKHPELEPQCKLMEISLKLFKNIQCFYVNSRIVGRTLC